MLRIHAAVAVLFALNQSISVLQSSQVPFCYFSVFAKICSFYIISQ